MTDVVAIGDVVIGVGDVQGLQRGTAVSWVSRDGLTWVKSPEAPVQEGAEFYAITPGGAGRLRRGCLRRPGLVRPGRLDHSGSLTSKWRFAPQREGRT